MKKLIFGIALMFTGALLTAAILGAAILSPLHPYAYNGVEGLAGVVLGMGLTMPLTLSVLLLALGALVAALSAYSTEKV